MYSDSESCESSSVVEYEKEGDDENKKKDKLERMIIEVMKEIKLQKSNMLDLKHDNEVCREKIEDMEEEITKYKIRLSELQATTERTALKMVENYEDHAQESKEPCLDDDTSKQTEQKALTSQNDQEDELLLVFNEFETLLEEYKFKFGDYEAFTNPEGESIIDQQLKFKAVNVILVDVEGTKLTSRTQNFAITHQIELSQLIAVAVKFWDLGKEPESFLMYLVEDDGTVFLINDADLNSLIQYYLINKKQVKRAIFILIDKTIKTSFDQNYEYKINKKELKNEDKTEITKEVERFFISFTGQAFFMREMFVKLLLEEKEMTKQKNAKGGISITFILFLAFYVLVFGAFTIISLVSLIFLRPPDNTFFYTQSAKHILNDDLFAHRKYLTVDEYHEDILHKLQSFFTTNVNSTVFDQTVLPITALRIGLYQVRSQPCDLDFIQSIGVSKEKKCYPLLYEYDNEIDPIENTYLSNSDYLNDTSIFPADSTQKASDKFFYRHISINNLTSRDIVNYFTDYQSVEKFYQAIINNIYQPVNDGLDTDFEMVGRLGTFIGRGQSMYLSINQCNKEVFSTLLRILRKEDNIFEGGLRGISFSTAIMIYPSEAFFYINILYEYNAFKAFLKPKITVRQFYPNIYQGKTGQIFLTLDIIRLLLSIIIFIMANNAFLESKKRLLPSETNIVGYSKIALQPRISLSLMAMVFYIAKFAITFKSLFMNLETEEFITQNSNTQNSFYSQRYYDYDKVSSDFENVIVLETIIIFSIFCRLLYMFYGYNRVRIFFEYLGNSLSNIFTYLCITAMFIFCLSICANNIYGQHFDSFRDIGASINSLLLITIGHTGILPQPERNEPAFHIFFIVVYILCFVFFFLNTFIGIYMDSHRIIMTRDSSIEHEKLLYGVTNYNKYLKKLKHANKE